MPSLKLMSSTCRIEAAAAFDRRITDLDTNLTVVEDETAVAKYHQLVGGAPASVAAAAAAAVAADLLYQRLYEAAAEQKTAVAAHEAAAAMPVSGDCRSPRKRPTNDFEAITSLFTAAGMSPKRIKL